MKLGNIVYQGNLVNHEKVDYINYINEPVSYNQIPIELPTLYVGWFMMKEINKDILFDNQSILDKKIVTDKLYWEFSFKENKSQHVDGISSFVRNVPYYYFKPKYNYINIDPVFFQIENIDDLNNILAKEYDAVYNFKGEMLYMLNTKGLINDPYKQSRIVGIDLNMYEHFEFDIDQLLQTLHKKVPTNKIYNDFDGEKHEKYYKIFPNFDELKRYLVVLLSKA